MFEDKVRKVKSYFYQKVREHLHFCDYVVVFKLFYEPFVTVLYFFACVVVYCGLFVIVCSLICVYRFVMTNLSVFNVHDGILYW